MDNQIDQKFHNQWFSQLPIRIIGSAEQPLFYATDVATVLGVTNIRSMLINFSEKDTISLEQRKKLGIITYKKYRDVTRKDNKMILVTESGARRMVALARSPAAQAIRDKLNNEFYKIIPESDFLNKIMAVFSTEIFELQKYVLRYRIDAYMPKYKLAIEFDENGHKYQIEQDIERENWIIAELHCKFIRFNQNDNIFEAAGKIYERIHKGQN